MRKTLITPIPQDAPAREQEWLDLDGAAVVEVTSEEKDYPVESALVPGEMRGWRAAAPGTQTIRLIFDQPQRLRRISLVFEENEIKRTQEFVCGGLRMADARFETSCASSGISAPLTRYAKSRNTKLHSRMSPCFRQTSARDESKSNKALTATVRTL